MKKENETETTGAALEAEKIAVNKKLFYVRGSVDVYCCVRANSAEEALDEADEYVWEISSGPNWSEAESADPAITESEINEFNF